MNVFDLFAKLSLDSTEYDQGLDKAKSAGSSLGSGLASAAKIGLSAVGVATGATVAFGASSVKAGAEFDKSMSQVAATMGKTVGELQNEVGTVDTAWGKFTGNLREYAQFMGSNTAFSASQAADALNYMALAGYQTDEAMSMLPNVLNLAAAGDMELARASDMVTDAQSALGLEMQEMDGFVDQLAKTASKSNTSVSQLGEAILTIGGTAKTLSGGTTELNTALGILADNGIKGAEGGTKLRNVILSLSAPTDKAAEQLEALGVNTKDAQGNMLPLEDIMVQLNSSLKGLGTADKAEIIKKIFNKQDIAAVNALLDTSTQRWDELSTAIDDSQNAAADMAKTQLDNLAGDVTLFQSALEGAKIAVSDGLTPVLRQFVQFGTDGLSKITTAFQEDGVSGAIQAFGEILTEGLNMLFEALPNIIDAGIMLLKALGQGIMDNLDILIDASIQIITMIGEGFIQAAPEIVKAAVTIIGALGSALIENLPIILPQIIQLVVDLALYLANNADKLVSGVITLVTTIAQIMIENLPLLLSAVVQIVIALGEALIDNIPLLISSVEQIFWQLVDLIAEYGGKMMEDIWNWLVDLAKNVWQGMRNMFNNVVEWLSQLPSTMAYWIGYAVGLFINGIIHLPENLKKILDKVIDKVLSFGKDFKDNAKTSAKNFFDNLVNGIKELPAKMLQFAKDLLGAVASLPDDFMSIGSNIVQGIWNGISAGWDWLVSSVKNLASSLFEGAKAALGIASPSKKFMWVGQMVDEGFAKGINDNADMVTSAMDAITDVSGVVSDMDVTGAGATAGAGTYIINVNQPVATPSEMADAIRLESQYGLILGGGLLA